MKKYIITAVLVISACMFSQGNMGSIKAGMFFPGATDGGFDLGLEYGLHIDTNLDVGISLDWFKKDYEDEDIKGDYEEIPGLTADQVATLSETTIYDFPLMLAVTAKFPIGPKLKWFAAGGLGAEMLYASYTSFENGDMDEKSELAFDFNWRLGGGMMYNLGRRSEIFGELMYHYSEPSYEYEDEVNSTKLKFKRVYDMSGILSRVGVRFFFN